MNTAAQEISNKTKNSKEALRSLRNKALELLRNKDYEGAYKEYKKILDDLIGSQDKFKYRDVNNILVCIYHIYSDKKEAWLFDEFEKYLKEYIDLAHQSDTTTWANNIIEDLLEYAVEVAFIYFTENDNDFPDQKKQIINWFEQFIISFINELTIEEESKRSATIFYDVILRIIFKERTNFERKGHEYQNVVNAKNLGEFFLKLTKDAKGLNRSRSNVYQLFSELIFNDPEKLDQDFYYLTRGAVEYLDKSLEVYKNNSFATKRKKQLNDIIISQEQLHRFDHDVSSKISTLKSLIRRLKRKADELPEPKQMERIINDINVILDLSKGEMPDIENVDMLKMLEEIRQESKINLEIRHQGENETWLSNESYFKIIFENLIKNSREAYKRRGIDMPDPAVLITMDFNEEKITLQDWAGGISEDFLRNDKLFEPYVSEKGVAQSTGLGLALVKDSCNKLSLSIKYKTQNNSTIIVIQKNKE